MVGPFSDDDLKKIGERFLNGEEPLTPEQEKAISEGVRPRCIYPRCAQIGACTPECAKRFEPVRIKSRPPVDPELMKKLLEDFRRGSAVALSYGAQVTFGPPALFTKLSVFASEPTRAKEGDAGYDLFVSRPARVPIGHFTDTHTDIAIALPPGYFGRITGRSSTLRKRGLLVNEGIIDNGYRGEMFVAVYNLSQVVVDIEPGERLAQLIIQRIETIQWQETEEPLPSSDRGSRGFGSTGK